MLHISTILTHYKREDIQKAILDTAKNREVGFKHGEMGFFKRPDVLNYPNDVLDLAKNGVTSFHISEERWTNPLNISPDQKKESVDELRNGWDLIIDIDFPVWEGTRLITKEIISSLKAHGITSVSCKFSGNKGFHIAVPYESFPQVVSYQGIKKETKMLFPDLAKRIFIYILECIDSSEKNYPLSKKIQELQEFNEYPKKDELLSVLCINCGTKYQPITNSIEFICHKCDGKAKADAETKFMICEKCKIHMERFEIKIKQCKCKTPKVEKKLNLGLDTVMLSTRHLYRSVYSLHEKSGLCSVPIDPDKIMEFRRENADPKKIIVSKIKFLDTSKSKPEEAKTFFMKAIDFKPQLVQEQEQHQKEFSALSEAAPEQFFPPCIHNIFKGIRDGKKRSLFILFNFLRSAGWQYDDIEKKIKEWNQKNPETIRENYLSGHLKYHHQKKPVLPPNCNNEMYYIGIGVCTPDNLCEKIKNPVQYLKRKIPQNEKKVPRRTRKDKKQPQPDKEAEPK